MIEHGQRDATRRGRIRPMVRWGLLAVALLSAGCGGPQRPAMPRMFPSPYPAPKLWAVMPFRDESGTSVVDGAAFADRLTQQLQQVEGIRVLPVNRVIETMTARDLIAVDSAGEAMELAAALGVDGLLVGTITAWDPYEPPKIGAVVQLYSRRRGGAAAVDSRRLSRSTRGEAALPGAARFEQPIAEAGGYFDAANGEVRRNLRHYATGRAPIDSPAGWRRYLLNMDLYSEFVNSELMRRLFAAEWDRLTEAPGPDRQAETENRTSP